MNASRWRARPTIPDAEYRKLRQMFVTSVIARCEPSVRRSAEQLLGAGELQQLRDAVCAVVDQFIRRADHPLARPERAKPRLAAVNEVRTVNHVNQAAPEVNDVKLLDTVNRHTDSGLTQAQRCADVNRASTKVVNGRQPLPEVNRLSEQQYRILDLAARSEGVSSHELVIIVGGDRIRTCERTFIYDGSPPRIVRSPAARSIAASVSRSLSRLKRAKLIEERWHLPYRDLEQRMVDGNWRYHATAVAAL